jgi:hypothetical protein
VVVRALACVVGFTTGTGTAGTRTLPRTDLAAVGTGVGDGVGVGVGVGVALGVADGVGEALGSGSDWATGSGAPHAERNARAKAATATRPGRGMSGFRRFILACYELALRGQA